MKKLIASLGAILTAGLLFGQSDTTRGKYDYYPDGNIYFNEVSKTYWFHDSAAKKWRDSTALPSNYSVDGNRKKSTFYYNGNNVWEKNEEHVKTYGKKVKPKKPSR